MRIWAVSESGSWNTYKEKDLVVVSSPYPSDTVGTYRHEFVKP